jgi:hypothetical protein
MDDPIKDAFEGWAKLALAELSAVPNPRNIDYLTRMFLLARYLYFPVDSRRQQIEDSLTDLTRTASEHPHA